VTHLFQCIARPGHNYGCPIAFPERSPRGSRLRHG
jgi:hypothetical protein